MEAGALSFLYRLFLAHFLADFPFQPTELYRLKTRSIWGSTFHGAVFGVLALALVLPSPLPVWGMVGALTAFHILVDHLKVRIFLRGGPENFGSFSLDQAAHVGAILASTYAFPPSMFAPLSNFILPDKAVLIAAFLVLSAFGGTVILFILKQTLWPSSSQEQEIDKGWKECAGVVERGVITGLFFIKLWPLAPLVALGKGALLYLCHRPKGGRAWKVFLVDTLASASLAALLGWVALNLPLGR